MHECMDGGGDVGGGRDRPGWRSGIHGQYDIIHFSLPESSTVRVLCKYEILWCLEARYSTFTERPGAVPSSFRFFSPFQGVASLLRNLRPT